MAGVLVFVVAFWFDGGLFDLPTAALFWVLLELGAARGGKVDSPLFPDPNTGTSWKEKDAPLLLSQPQK